MSTAAPVRNRASALWASLPRDLKVKFRPLAGQLTRDMIREIQQAVPAYARPLAGRFGADLTKAVEQAVLRTLDTIGDGGGLDENWANVFRQLGRIEFLAGRSLDSLQTAYRVGGRVAWRYISTWGQQQRLPVAMFSVTAEAIFAYVEEISTLSITGYTMAQAESATLVERRRRRLVELILADPPASPHALAKLAELANWRLPNSVAVVVVEHHDDPHDLPRLPAHQDVLMDLDGDPPCLIMADPQHHGRRLGRELPGRRMCVGPTVNLGEAALSLRWANRAMGLVKRGIIGGGPVIWCRDHLATLGLLADEFLVGELIKRALAPLAALTAKQRMRTAETVLAWLETRGSATDMARQLKIHPQTVRYRMRQVEQLFGPALGNPPARLELEIALRAQRLMWTAS